MMTENNKPLYGNFVQDTNIDRNVPFTYRISADFKAENGALRSPEMYVDKFQTTDLLAKTPESAIELNKFIRLPDRKDVVQFAAYVQIVGDVDGSADTITLERRNECVMYGNYLLFSNAKTVVDLGIEMVKQNVKEKVREIKESCEQPNTCPSGGLYKVTLPIYNEFVQGSEYCRDNEFTYRITVDFDLQNGTYPILWIDKLSTHLISGGGRRIELNKFVQLPNRLKGFTSFSAYVQLVKDDDSCPDISDKTREKCMEYGKALMIYGTDIVCSLLGLLGAYHALKPIMDEYGADKSETCENIPGDNTEEAPINKSYPVIKVVFALEHGTVLDSSLYDTPGSSLLKCISQEVFDPCIEDDDYPRFDDVLRNHVYETLTADANQYTVYMQPNVSEEEYYKMNVKNRLVMKESMCNDALAFLRKYSSEKTKETTYTICFYNDEDQSFDVGASADPDAYLYRDIILKGKDGKYCMYSTIPEDLPEFKALFRTLINDKVRPRAKENCVYTLATKYNLPILLEITYGLT